MGIRVLVGILLVCSGLVSASRAAEETVHNDVVVAAKLKLIESEEGVDTVLARPMIMSVVSKPFSIDGGGFLLEGTFHPPRDGRVGAELKFVMRSSSKDKDDDQESHQITTQVDSRFSAKPGETKRIQLNATQRLEMTLDMVQADDQPVAKPGTHLSAVPSTRPPAPAKQIAATFLLFEQGPDGNRRLLAEPTLATIVGRPAAFWSGGEKFIKGAPSDPWQLGTRVDLHIYELKDDRVDVEFKFSVSTAKSPDQGPDTYQELHLTGEQFRSRFKAKLGESKIIRSTSGRWLEVIFDEIDPSSLVPPRRQALEEDAKALRIGVRISYFDLLSEGTPLRQWLDTQVELTPPYEHVLGKLSHEGRQISDKTPGVTKATTRDIVYAFRLDDVTGDNAAIEFTMKHDESWSDEANDESVETCRRATEHRFSFRGQSGQTKVLKISEQQRVEVTFTWE